MSYQRQKGFSWLSVLFFVVVLVTLVGFIAPLVLFSRGGRAGPRTIALANAKSIVSGLLIFREDRGYYPCDKTRKDLEKEGINFLPKGTSANAYLAQLVATETIDSELSFFAPGNDAFRKGDDEKNTAESILAPGENGFAYIMAADGKPLTDTSSFTPLVLAPIKAKGKEPIFDAEAYGGKFVYGLVDGSAAVGDINENGHAISKGRTSFFQTGRDSLFGDHTPVVKYPLRLQ